MGTILDKPGYVDTVPMIHNVPEDKVTTYHEVNMTFFQVILQGQIL
jgi:hypothetical protein